MAGDEAGSQEQECTGGVTAQEPPTVDNDSDGAATARTGMDYEAFLAEHDAKIAELEGSIAEAAKTAETAESLHAEMDELRRQIDGQRIEFELTMADASNVRVFRILLDEHGGRLQAEGAELWVFEGAVHRQFGKIGLPDAGAASDVDKTMKRRREIERIADEEWQMANNVAPTKNYTTMLDEVYQRAACPSSPRCMLRTWA